MTDEIKTANRDEVLFAFHQECKQPSAEQIVAWVNRFPQFAEDIRAHAAVAWDWATQTMDSEVDVDETMSARAYSQALNIIRSEPVSSVCRRYPRACCCCLGLGNADNGLGSGCRRNHVGTSVQPSAEHHQI